MNRMVLRLGKPMKVVEMLLVAVGQAITTLKFTKLATMLSSPMLQQLLPIALSIRYVLHQIGMNP